MDAVIAAAEEHDFASLEGQIRYTKQSCVLGEEVTGGIDGRPRCEGSERTGDVVDAFFTPQCEPVFARGTDVIRKWVDHEFNEVTQFFGAYDAGYEKVGKYVVAFSSGAPNLAVVALVDDAGIVGVGNFCGGTAQQLFGLRTPIAAQSTP